MITLYSYYRSSSAWRVRIVLHLKGIAHRQVAINIARDVSEQDAVGFEQVNALRQVPVLQWQHEGHVERITQSVAIIEYLEETHPTPALLPKEPLARARVREAVEIVCSGIQPLQNNRTLAEITRLGGDVAEQVWARTVIARGLSALEVHARAHGGGFSVGDTVSLADVFLVPQLQNARRYGVDLGAFPTLLAIDARARALPGFMAAHPDRQPDAPAPTT